MQFLSRPLIYIKVYPGHLEARVVGEGRTIRRDCHALDNRRSELKDFSRIRGALRGVIKELTPGFRLRRPFGLMHFMPDQYVPTQNELETFKKTAERAGVSFCWLSKWETPHTDRELQSIRGAL